MDYKNLLETDFTCDIYPQIDQPSEASGEKKHRIFCIKARSQKDLTIIENVIESNLDWPCLIAVYTDEEGINEILELTKAVNQILKNKQQNIQVAICSKLPENDLYMVKTVVKSGDASSSLRSIRRQAYYIPDISESDVSRFFEVDFQEKSSKGCADEQGDLKENTRQEKDGDRNDTIVAQNEDKSGSPEFFPFDLFIPCHFENSQGFKSMFIAYLELLMNREIGSDKYACRISNVHVSFDHGIHSDTFYDLAAVLHNTEMIERLAILIARNIYRENRSECNNLLLVGYEKQTRLLVLRIKDILEKSCDSKPEISHIIYMHDKECDYLSKAPDAKVDTTQKAVFIMPWSITLTWLSDMKSRLEADFNIGGGYWSQSLSICILLEGTGTVGKVEYWKKSGEQGDANEFHCATAYSKDIKEISIKYLLGTEQNKQVPIITDWVELSKYVNEDGDRKGECGIFLNLPPVYPDKSNLYLETIISESNPAENAGTDMRHSEEEKAERSVFDERFKKLFGCIRYSHIGRNEKHFRYYIDYRRFDNESKEGISQWLKQLKNNDSKKYNVILSPLSDKNSRFLEAVIKEVFEGNCRLIQIPFDEMEDDNITNRYSYIINELKNINESAKMETKLYYVYNTVNSRHHIVRGLEIYNSLCPQDKRLNKYDGMFLLHSNDIGTIIDNYVISPEENVHIYLKLSIPLGNSAFGRCVTCEHLYAYQTLSKSASSSKLMQEYHRLSEKDKLRTDREYDVFANGLRMKQHSYFMWLKEWLYRAHILKEERYMDPDSLVEREQFIETFNAMSKGELDASHCATRLQSDLLSKIVDYRNFTRLRCLHNAFEVTKNTCSAYGAFSSLLSLMCGEVCKFPEYSGKYQDNIQEVKKQENSMKAERILSYAKVISRPPFTNKYHLRHAVFVFLKLLKKMFDGSAKEPQCEKKYGDYVRQAFKENTNTAAAQSCVTENDDKNIKTIYHIVRGESIYAATQYRFYNSIVQLLAIFQDVETFAVREIENVMAKYQKLSEKQEKEQAEAKKWNDIPDKDKVFFDIVRATKWMTTAYASKGCCIGMEQPLKKKIMKRSGWQNYEPYAALFLENTGLLYSLLEWHRTRQGGNSGKTFKCYLDDAAVSGRYIWLNHFSEKSNKKYMLKKIDDIYKLFDLLCNLDESVMAGGTDVHNDTTIKDWEYPYKYEEVCNTIKRIADADDCFIVYSKNSETRLCARSSYRIVSGEIEDGMDINDINSCISEKEQITDSVYYSKRQNGTATLLLLEIRLKEGWNKEGSVYIVLSRDSSSPAAYSEYKRLGEAEPNTIYSRLVIARNILCMRNRLYKVFQRDVSVLMRFPNEYWYVRKRLTDGKTNILLLSDLHISDENYENAKTNIEKINNELNEIKFDLLIITGDVANRGDSASTFEHNYNLAASLIKKLAVRIFGCVENENENENKNRYLEHDWKKRIIIITGNHDYASMNELKAQSDGRTTQVGVPASDEGSTMAKFSYYINFIRRLLDINAGQLIDNKLYEVRTYKQLDIRTYSVNTSSKANMIRNNRFAFEVSALKKLMLPYDGGIKNHIILMHHPVLDEYDAELTYRGVATNEQFEESDNEDGKLNYILDKYVPINRIYILIYEFMQKVGDDEKQSAFKDLKEYSEKEYSEKKSFNKLSPYTKKLIEHIQYAEYETFKGDIWLYDAMVRITENMESGIFDTKAFSNETAKAIKCIEEKNKGSRIMIFCGHVHRWYEKQKCFTYVNEESKEANCPVEIISDCFKRGQNKEIEAVRFATLSISNAGGEPPEELQEHEIKCESGQAVASLKCYICGEGKWIEKQ